MGFYAVANGRNIGIFTSWDECSNSTKGYKNAIYKKFDTKEEAENFIKLNSINNKERTNFVPDYYVYTDGACSNNGKANAVAGIGIFFGIDDVRNVSKKIGGKQTNNTAELSAVIETYHIIQNDIVDGKNILIFTDSKYVLRCVATFGDKCYKKGWEVDIPNRELVQMVYDMYKNKLNVKFLHVKAHTDNTDIHSIGNFNADKLANMAIDLNNCPYEKLYLDVPFAKKEEIKKLGGMWDAKKKKWFIYDNNKNKGEILDNYADKL